jgi:hypothetical protein
MTLPTMPTGIFEPTTPPEPLKPAAEQGGDGLDTTPGEAVGGKAAKGRKKKPASAAADKIEDQKLYLTEDVRFRLRMLAFKRGTKISTVANEVLDKALPRWTLERTE